MKFTARAGTTAAVGFLLTTLGLTSAVADVTPSPSETPAETAPVESPTPTPNPPPPSPSPSLTGEACSIAIDPETVVISLPASVDTAAISQDDLTISVDGQQLTDDQIGPLRSDIELDRDIAVGELHVELDYDGVAIECRTAVSATETPTPPPDDDETGGSDGDETGPPSQHPEPAPTQTATSPPVNPSPEVSAPATPGPGPMPDPTPEFQPSPPETVVPMPTSETLETPTQLEESATQTPASGPRNIRNYPDNPRFLLPHLLGMNSQYDSPLVLPHPRNAALGEPGLETLPPISEDELNALKARASTGNHAGRSGDERQDAASNAELSTTTHSGWILFGLVLLIGVVLGAWWALGRRKRAH